MIATSLIELVPESLSLSENNAMYILLGFSMMHLFHHVISTHFHFGEETHSQLGSGSWIGTFIGMLIHTFFDGVAIAASFKVDFHLGIDVFLVILLHKITDGLTIASITLVNKKSRKKALLSGVYLGLSTLLGSLSFIYLDNMINFSNIRYRTCCFCWNLYIRDLLTSVNETNSRYVSLLFMVGQCLFLFSSIFH